MGNRRQLGVTDGGWEVTVTIAFCQCDGGWFCPDRGPWEGARVWRCCFGTLPLQHHVCGSGVLLSNFELINRNFQSGFPEFSSLFGTPGDAGKVLRSPHFRKVRPLSANQWKMGQVCRSLTHTGTMYRDSSHPNTWPRDSLQALPLPQDTGMGSHHGGGGDRARSLYATAPSPPVVPPV